MRIRTHLHRAAVVLAAAALLTTAACGDDEEPTSADRTTTEADATTTASTEAETTATTGADLADGVEITAIDYAYEGVPESITAGTPLRLTNDSEAEVHELVAVRLPDDETRTLEEITSDPASIGPLFSGGPPAAVIVAAPGSSMPGAVLGDGSLAEPGRYVLVCSIPTGADPDAYLEAAQSSAGPPDVPGGPPHFVQGMVSEIQVEAP